MRWPAGGSYHLVVQRGIARSAALTQGTALLRMCFPSSAKTSSCTSLLRPERAPTPPSHSDNDAGAGAEHGGGGAAELAASHNDVAEVLKKQGRYEEAIGYYKMALEEMETIAEVDCASPVPLLATYHNNLASCLKNLGHRCFTPFRFSGLSTCPRWDACWDHVRLYAALRGHPACASPMLYCAMWRTSACSRSERLSLCCALATAVPPHRCWDGRWGLTGTSLRRRSTTSTRYASARRSWGRGTWTWPHASTTSPSCCR
jgi:hypothetical protein